MERLIDWLIKQFVPEGVPAKVALRAWFREEGYWYVASGLVHAIGFVILAILFSALPEMFPSVFGSSEPKETLTLDAASVEAPVDAEIPRFEIGQASFETSTLSPDTLLLGPQAPQKALYIDDSDTFVEPGGGKPSDLQGPKLGGDGGFSWPNRLGPAGKGGLGVSSGTGDTPGAGGGLGTGLGGRGSGRREALAGTTGGTGASERAVAGGLNWLARHQSPSGNWSLQFTKHCKGGSCSGQGEILHDSGATAMVLLAFQGAGQTHKAKGPYRERVQKGVSWLLKHQDARSGDLSAGAPQPMYSHGLATIALCEAYGMTKDEIVGAAAAKAVRFIERAQNEATGGWRYTAGSHDADTSVLGWQVMALKSAQMAGIGVNSMTFEGARRYLGTVAQGQNRGLYVYMPYREVSPSMTAVGMLCQQYLGIARDDPSMVEGRQYLLANLPDPNLNRDIYYWYYATLAMHNFMGPEWDRWNRQMRRTLISTQCKGGCAEGSWDPEHPALDKWARAGRLYMTALSTLTLEVYYRYLPLFQINQGPQMPAPPNKMGLVIGLPTQPAPDKPASRTP